MAFAMNKICSSAVNLDEIRKIDCFKGDSNEWIVYGWYKLAGDGFTFAKFKTEEEAQKYFHVLIKTK